MALRSRSVRAAAISPVNCARRVSVGVKVLTVAGSWRLAAGSRCRSRPAATVSLWLAAGGGLPAASCLCRRLRVCRLGGLDPGDELTERCRVAHRQVGELLAIELDVRGAQAGDELPVRQAVLAGGRVDADDPQAPEVALLVAPADVGVLERRIDRFLRIAIQAALVPEHPLRPGEQLAA